MDWKALFRVIPDDLCDLLSRMLVGAETGAEA